MTGVTGWWDASPDPRRHRVDRYERAAGVRQEHDEKREAAGRSERILGGVEALVRARRAKTD